MIRITDTVKHLIIINVIMFIGTIAIGHGELFYKWFALYFPKNDLFQPWQIITHMFMHGNVMHIAFNMLALWMFGSAVEQQLGSQKFLFIYFSAGLGAVLLQLGVYYFQYFSLQSSLVESGIGVSELHEMLTSNRSARQFSAEQMKNVQGLFDVYYASMVGASGCLMGILAAFGMMNPEAKLMLIFLPIPVKAKYFIPGLIILDLISGFRGQSIFGYGNIAHFAHVGGALTGFIIMWYWKKTQFNKNRWY